MPATTPRKTMPEAIQNILEIMVRLAAKDGYIITIEQRPLKPLAMGHFETVVEVRPARGQP